MSAFDQHKDELEHYEQMLGRHRGRLAVSLDRVTNAMVFVGQHGVYCHSNRDHEQTHHGYSDHSGRIAEGQGTDSERDGRIARGTRAAFTRAVNFVALNKL